MGPSGTLGGRHLPQREAQMTLSLKQCSPMDPFLELCGATQGQSCLFAHMGTFQKKATCTSFPNAGRRRHKASIQVLPVWLHATLPPHASTYPLQSLLAPSAACPTCRPSQKPLAILPINSSCNPLQREWQDLKTHIEHCPCQAFVQPLGLLRRKPFAINIQHKHMWDEKNLGVSQCALREQ